VHQIQPAVFSSRERIVCRLEYQSKVMLQVDSELVLPLAFELMAAVRPIPRHIGQRVRLLRTVNLRMISLPFSAPYSRSSSSPEFDTFCSFRVLKMTSMHAHP
jgi:hypothetical protein